MTPSERILIAATRLNNQRNSATERATAALLVLISDRLHERGFYPEPELKAALALADAVESEHGEPEASATQPLPGADRDDWENDFSNCPRCGKPRANSWTDHCEPCDGPQRIVSGGDEAGV